MCKSHITSKMKNINSFSFYFSFLLYPKCSIPSGYYDSANGLDDNALKLPNNIIDGHTEFPYSSSRLMFGIF